MTESERRTFLRNAGLTVTAAAFGDPLTTVAAHAQASKDALPGRAAENPNDATRRLARFIVAARFEDLAEAVRHEARRTLLNWVGCAVGGSHHATVTNAIAALTPFFGA